jgi:hypothetical protein
MEVIAFQRRVFIIDHDFDHNEAGPNTATFLRYYENGNQTDMIQPFPQINPMQGLRDDIVLYLI